MSDLGFNQKVSPAELATAIDNMSSQPNMFIVKRDGRKEEISFDKITRRVTSLCDGLNMSFIDPLRIVKSVIEGLFSGAKTSQLDTLAAEVCASLSNVHHDYNTLAARIEISNLHKETSGSFVETVRKLYNCERDGEHCPMVTKEFLDDVEFHGAALDAAIDYTRDYDYGYFAIKTLQKSYLLKFDGHIIERPQHMLMRVAVALHGRDLDAVIETYEAMSQRKFIHASPTLFNAGTKRNGLASCFVKGTQVFTLDGVKNIEDVQIGDMVVTHKGNAKKVLQVHKNLRGDRQLYDVSVFKTPDMTVTGNHRFWSIQKDGFHEDTQPAWHSIEELKVGDWIAIPDFKKNDGHFFFDLAEFAKVELHENDARKLIFDIKETTIDVSVLIKQAGATRFVMSYKRFWTVDENFAKLLGIWYGDGCAFTRKCGANKTYGGINIVAHSDNEEIIEFIQRTMTKCLGITPGYHKLKNQNVVQLSISQTFIGYVFASLFGHGFDGKRINEQMFKWPRRYVEAFVAGLISADGCIARNGCMSLTMTNSDLTTSLYHWFRSHNIPVSRIEQTNWGKLQKHATFTMFFGTQCTFVDQVMKTYTDDRIKNIQTCTPKSIKIINGQYFMRISKKAPSDRNDDIVYTLGVEDDHSYAVNGLVAENCFLLHTPDSIEGLFDTVKEVATISALSGGIGMNISEVRAKGSLIKSTGGSSEGIIPYLRVLNNVALMVTQSSKRPGAVAVYLEVSHPEILEFLELKRLNGREDMRTRDLFLAAWIPDLFMEKVEKDEEWCLFCPSEAPGLAGAYGEEYRKLYSKYEAEGKYRKKIQAREIWDSLVKSQIESGVPYVAFKDRINLQNNQAHYGTIRNSNLCIEVVQYCDKDETSVCILGSMCLPSYVKNANDGSKYFDHEELGRNVRNMTRNLNKVIDVTMYPSEKARRSNMRHRPMAIGVSGLQDMFLALKLAFDSPEARKLNAEVSETIYYHAISESCELAKKFGPYDSYEGSGFSKGQFQFDLAQNNGGRQAKFSGRYKWDSLRQEVIKNGMRNSLLTGYMPTASTATILGVSECVEPLHGVIYMRRTMSGEFQMVNKYLVNDLVEAGMWNETTKNLIIQHRGSVQNINVIPDDIKRRYKTVWEISQKVIIDMAADRQMFTDQTQSMNLFKAQPTYSTISSMLMYGWKQGLKTGVYYLRSQPRVAALQFTQSKIVQQPVKDEPKRDEESGPVCRMEEGCVSCSG